jgi:hypothetical protein
MLLAIAALALQPAQAPDPAVPAPDPRQVTVIEREGEAEEIPLASRIARPVTEGFAPDPIAALHLREWADCIVRIYRPASLDLLATPLNSPEQAAIINRLTGHRFTRRTICARFRTMRVDNLVLRGAIAEALYRWEERRGRSAGPLVPPPPAPAAAGAPALLAQMGRCVVERDPEAAARVMATRPGTGAARRALAGLSGRVGACMPTGLRAREIHPLTLRGALGEPYYHRRRSPEGRPLSSAGGSRPGS